MSDGCVYVRAHVCMCMDVSSRMCLYVSDLTNFLPVQPGAIYGYVMDYNLDLTKDPICVGLAI